jgi:hypothetical protein
MDKDLREIVEAAVCSFNVGIDINGELTPEISKETCAQKCSYCTLAADYILSAIQEHKDGKQQSNQSYS